ncbi:hypothetical protein E1B28_005572 [Marasmius oreades]|uniref:Uncharacterized protein n=1 Tax=Marasmius oreades TaxID=181124 RepID=A0A9P7UVS5_9AGAR|nr:uncharacterized protein E1B28_005572 [Marasmius oreades]KAG7094756.1 hypothetical protein E1B28_005572 [Marasmius oreades]
MLLVLEKPVSFSPPTFMTPNLADHTENPTIEGGTIAGTIPCAYGLKCCYLSPDNGK